MYRTPKCYPDTVDQLCALRACAMSAATNRPGYREAAGMVGGGRYHGGPPLGQGGARGRPSALTTAGHERPPAGQRVDEVTGIASPSWQVCLNAEPTPGVGSLRDEAQLHDEAAADG